MVSTTTQYPPRVTIFMSQFGPRSILGLSLTELSGTREDAVWDSR